MQKEEEKSKVLGWLYQAVEVTAMAIAGVLVMVVAMVNRRR